MSLADHPDFDKLTPDQVWEVQDWYARRFLSLRDLGRRRVKSYQTKPKLTPIKIDVDLPSKLLQTPAGLRDPLQHFSPAYKAMYKRPGSGNYGNTNGQGRNRK